MVSRYTIPHFVLSLSFRILLFFLVIAAGGVFAADAKREAEHPDFLRGSELLEKGQFKAALGAFKAAAEAEPDNELYQVERALLQRIVDTRAAIQKEKSLLRWTAQAKLLHSYYHRKELHRHLVDISTRIHDRQSTPMNAMLLAESHIIAGQTEEALAILNRIEAAEFPVQLRTQLLIVRAGALVATNNREEAHRILKSVEIEKISDPGVIYRFAVMCAEVGLNRKAVQSLTLAFRRTPVCFLGGMKERARNEPAFQRIRNAAEFAAALNVQSTVMSPLCERNLHNVPDQNAKGAKPVVGKVDLNQWNLK